MRIMSRVIAVLVAAILTTPLAAHAAEEAVAFKNPGYSPGTIIVNTSERRLYLVLGGNRALRYPVGVGKAGKQWSGRAQIVAKFLKPDWVPSAAVKRGVPGIPDFIAGGAPSNPMGAAAMVLTGGTYAIHGTNRPNSIGGYVSYGCIRMYNADVLRLFARVGVGTPVVVLR